MGMITHHPAAKKKRWFTPELLQLSGTDGKLNP
jgi:hypothetical protein